MTAPDSCRSARKALRYYRAIFRELRARMGGSRYPAVNMKPRNCSEVRMLAARWHERARVARGQWEAWRRYHYDWRRSQNSVHTIAR